VIDANGLTRVGPFFLQNRPAGTPGAAGRQLNTEHRGTR